MDPVLASLCRHLLPLEGHPSPRPPFQASAVLLLLFPAAGSLHTILTVRSASVRHAGQVSLPGGRVEPIDVTPWHAALRETYEELGIPPETVAPLGRLPEVHVGASGFHIVPYVGLLDRPPVLRPHSGEVEEAVEIDVPSLLDPRSIRQDEWLLRGQPCLVSYFAVGGLRVWGATGRILTEFARGAGAHFPADRPLPGSVIRSGAEIP